MVWLAKWIWKNVENCRVLIITNRTELDEGITENVYCTRSGPILW